VRDSRIDALPGKQMAIDAELNAGIIDGSHGDARRVKVQKEAISTVRWTVFEVSCAATRWRASSSRSSISSAALRSGCCQMDLSLKRSPAKFTLLSIGDGLVSQIPLDFVVGAGILVNRASENSNLGTQLAGQLFRYPAR